MPGLNEKSAPRFESSTDPEELERFFSRLEELFHKSAIVTDVEKKKYAVSYTASHAVEFGQISMLISKGQDCKINANS